MTKTGPGGFKRVKMPKAAAGAADWRNTRAAHLAPVACPWCRYMIDRATAIAPKFERPQDGNFSLCIKCGCVSVFDTHGSLRKPTIAEQIEIDQSAKVGAARTVWTQVLDPVKH